MKCPRKCCILILAMTVAAVVLRLPRLQQRPMHGDEAVHAVKFSSLLENGFYRYDRDEYHGPTLNYLTLIPAWLSSAKKLSNLSESTLRIVPVFFGVCLVLLLLLLTDGLGPTTTVCAAVLTAVSPAFVFYSRYYIHEMLLVCFTFAGITSAYRYTQSKNITWALLAGAFFALCHATKETCIIAFGSMLVALLLTLLMRHRPLSLRGLRSRPRQSHPLRFRLLRCARNDGRGADRTNWVWHLSAAVGAAVIVSALFYSSFFTNPPGILDSLRTYTTYFNRAGQNQVHIHPWYYYLKMLIYFRYDLGPVWSEAFIVFLAAVGFIVAMMRKSSSFGNVHLLRFIAFYTAVMTVLYSIIPYKTPWCMLGFLHGMILLAAVGMVALVKLMPNLPARLLITMLLVAGGTHLAWQGYQSSYKFYADTCNPYVYAHTSTDVFTIAQQVERIAKAHPDRDKMHIQVICPEDDYWPLPWYLRYFSNVAYQNEVDEDMPPAPVIIASPSVEPTLMRKLYDLPPPGKRNLYIPLFDSYMELRPQIELRGYVTKNLWDSYQQHRAQPATDQQVKK